MTYFNSSVSVIGAGSYGTALAVALARNKHLVLLWGYNDKFITKLKHDRCNNTFLPNVPFSNMLIPESNLAKVVNTSQDLIIVVPSYAFSNILIQIKHHLRPDSRIVWATKGLEKRTGRLLYDVAREILGNNIPLAIIAGPAFAKELAIGLPTTITLVSNDKQFVKDLQNKFFYDSFLHIKHSSDYIGVQLSAAIKNVIAISVGISDGINFGSNARITLIINGLNEMSKLGTVLGADPATFTDMAGLGDLILTCTNNQSRNRYFGMMLGEGKSVEEARHIIGQVIEGYSNNKEIKLLAESVNVRMPIVEQMYQVLYCKKPAREAILNILNYSY
ncbi:NAD(P)H-dependent glycerol-3-phosphate dehydrogenase [Pantoea sp. Mhis]|uniref:NAD(P)H-dependent glycerol-3-phosphate dehydrogenase n=1 Tax=Pantoea sp. Mhis TaxID=2576759 RepID=UPI0013583611|nr:NAD(P)H-dependent glycerol-3-phosphate dehydrogenase [Pantoea sp. Mhis]MXP56645.1 NAD(P)H-dependent glycerol-3-phosphate dehydrogenase [Pantoea sp. Mhis]